VIATRPHHHAETSADQDKAGQERVLLETPLEHSIVPSSALPLRTDFPPPSFAV